MTTSPDALPQWKGTAVPWIARWSDEIIREPYSMAQTREGMVFVYPDGKENRDPRGYLWQREGLKRGGEPKFAQVNTYRQRASMRKCLCQVCGKKIDERPIRWLMPLEGIQRNPAGDPLTVSAPTCSDCIELALELCPHMKKAGYEILNVLEYSEWGVYGEAMLQTRQRLRPTFFGYDQDYGPQFSWELVFAKQVVVRLDKFTVEKRVEP